MGFLDSVLPWRWKGAKRQKELAALEHIKNTLMVEQSAMREVYQLVEAMKELLTQNKFQDAERYLPQLIQTLKRKKLMDKAELLDEKLLSKTMLRELKEQLKGIKSV